MHLLFLRQQIQVAHLLALDQHARIARLLAPERSPVERSFPYGFITLEFQSRKFSVAEVVFDAKGSASLGLLREEREY